MLEVRIPKSDVCVEHRHELHSTILGWIRSRQVEVDPESLLVLHNRTDLVSILGTYLINLRIAEGLVEELLHPIRSNGILLKAHVFPC
jgi:hypothetical protein